MKKLLITSACTLVLSLFGTLGANNDALNIKETLSNKLNTESVEQAESPLASTKATAKNTGKATKASKSNKAGKANVTVETNKAPKSNENIKADEAPKPNETIKANENNNIKATDNEYTKPASTVTDSDTKLNEDNINNIKYDNNKDCYTLNGKVIAYGNINPSELGSIEDIIAKFKASGYNVELPSNSNGNNKPSKPVQEKPVQEKPVQEKPVQEKPVQEKPVQEKPVEQPSKPTPAPSNNESSKNNSSFANQVLQLVNVERSKAGLSKLTMDTTLSAAAQKRAVEIETSFSHTRPNGTKFSTVLAEYGISYRTSGENLAYGQRSAEEVVNGWMNSPGHRANILNGNFNKIGIGVHSSNGTIYWSQLFTN